MGPSTPQTNSQANRFAALRMTGGWLLRSGDKGGPGSDARGPYLARDRGLVFRASTGAEVRNLLVRAKQRFGAFSGGLSGTLVELFHFFSYPTHAGGLNNVS